MRVSATVAWVPRNRLQSPQPHGWPLAPLHQQEMDLVLERHWLHRFGKLFTHAHQHQAVPLTASPQVCKKPTVTETKLTAPAVHPVTCVG